MEIVEKVFLAIDGEGFLPVGEKLSLEYLDSSYDGIFESLKSWKAFINSNFADGEYWQPIKESTVKKWCYPAKDYTNKFVVKIGTDKYVPVSPDDLEFEYDYKFYYKRGDNFPSAVEIFVTARIK